MVTIEMVVPHSLIEYIAPNIAEHYAQMTKSDEYGVPDMDWDGYIQASINGQLVAIALKDSGQFVGYVVFSICRNQRYKDRVEAYSEGFFVEQPYRSEWSALLLKAAINELKAMGIAEAQFIIDDDNLGRWFAMNGGKNTYQVWSF